LNATPVFEFMGLPPYNEDISQDDAIKLIQDRVILYTAAELEQMVEDAKQAGTTVLKREEFLASPHVSCLPNQRAAPLLTLVFRDSTLQNNLSSRWKL
jgi:hypothetical protein